ncbi:hypothetical protein [Mariniflexile sp.]|uniref:hypothetical protein n=1 Tax=Mariniflexile sp. TaxID=1979402 RepID=UPI004047659E
MKTKLLLLVLSMFLTLNVFAQPKKVLWVTNTVEAARYGTFDDAWIAFFIDKGFDASKFNQDDFDQAKLDFINGPTGPDIVIIARHTDSGKFNGSVADLWNAINKPMITLNPYTVRSTRLHWLPSATDPIQGGVFTQNGATGPEISSASQIIYPSDYIFRNIDITTAPDLRYYAGNSSFTAISQVDVELGTSGKVLFNNTEGAAAFIRFPKVLKPIQVQG